MTKTIQEVGEFIGRAIAKSVLDPTNVGMSREWSGLDGDDAANIPEGMDHAAVEVVAEATYHVAIGAYYRGED